ncbi:catalase family peroxidase [Kibdelosporangium lantanae]
MTDAATMVDALERMSGWHPGRRRAYGRGRCFDATFTPSGAAAPYTTACHLQHDRVDVVVRFSTNGNPAAIDPTEPAFRGMSVKFADTDLVAMNSPVFPAATPEKFLELLRMLAGKPLGTRARAEAVTAFVTAHPESVPAFRTAVRIATPASYATARFWAVHAFVWVAPDGTRRYVRYRWEPDAGCQQAGTNDGNLVAELVRRLRREPVSFTLKVQFAERGDPTDDPTRAWPDTRAEITAGRLDITGPAADEDFWNNHMFDPTRLAPGIELSDDPVLVFRGTTYGESFSRRYQEGTPLAPASVPW